ncbi:nucleotidyltransferase domain-containing protein [Micromonospora robiginosa]|uniref:Nucleotidyltransferase domain-containing protein n=1 Tax=Micromonospora robiginosa TaxID=2749844 RepID=A0A7L6B292_9ACTN|nr:nucleotidyltransferase domain-containing protein [Micromonospora ferruginea]QLQ36057.1 nucleotidyltransferase domain-containing protein [Micromonospora ferruginea]
MRDDVPGYLADLLRRARDVLGDELAGAYAAGSLGLGAYQPGRSDVDVALLVAAPPTVAAKRTLVDRLRHESLPCPARGLELVVYRRDVAASGTPEPGFELELNTGATMPFRATYDPVDRPAADGRFWYALDRSILRQSGLTLLGPPAADAFADPDPATLRSLLVDALRWWLALPTPPGDAPAPGAEDAVLGACRALVRCRDGVWLGKVDAGRRVAADDPDAALIHRAVAARAGGPPPSGPAARAFQRRVLARIEAD